jgi:hypothetical protein
MDDLASKDIYLKKDGQIIGLHALGYNEPYECEVIELDGSRHIEHLDFMALEKWGNAYDANLKMLPPGSFHVFDLSIEHTAREMEQDGWVRFDPFLK